MRIIDKFIRSVISVVLSAVIVNPYPVTLSSDSEMIYRHKKTCTDSRKIALTFDDGPHPVYTPEILNILDEYGVKATFFIIGENAAAYPDIVAETVRRGHEIGNHTYTHPHVTGKGSQAVSNPIMLHDIQKCEDIIFEQTDIMTKLYRPPEGYVCTSLLHAICKLDYSVILWSVDTRDWVHTPPDKIFRNVMKNTGPGDIILMHDYISVASPTPDALRLILPALIDKGFDFVNVSELIGSA